MAVPSFHLLMKLRKLYFESNKTSTHEPSLVLFETYHVEGYRCQCKLINFFDALSGFRIEVKVIIVDRKSIKFWLSHCHRLSAIRYLFLLRLVVFLNKGVNCNLDCIKWEILQVGRVFGWLLSKILSETFNVIFRLKNVLVHIGLFGLDVFRWSHIVFTKSLMKNKIKIKKLFTTTLAKYLIKYLFISSTTCSTNLIYIG